MLEGGTEVELTRARMTSSAHLIEQPLELRRASAFSRRRVKVPVNSVVVARRRSHHGHLLFESAARIAREGDIDARISKRRCLGNGTQDT